MRVPFSKNAILYSALLHLAVLNLLFLNLAYFDSTHYVTHSTVMNATLMEIPKSAITHPNPKKEISLPDKINKVEPKPLPEPPKPIIKKPKVVPRVEHPKPEPEKLEVEKAIKIEDKKIKPEKPKPLVKQVASEEKIVPKKEEKKIEPHVMKKEEIKEEKKIEKTLEQTHALKTQKNMEEKLWAEQLANEDKLLTTEKAQEAQGVINQYNALILAAIRAQWIMPENYPPDLDCHLLINLKSDGTVMDVQLAKSSGNEGFDRSARAAVYKASPLPVPKEAELFNQMKEINLVVRP